MDQHARTLVVFYPLETGECSFAEVSGQSVIHFGPFESRELAEKLLADMYPETPIVELPEQSAKLDDDQIMILGYATAQQVAFQEETGE
ncbi:hypothetical protein AB4156_21540 [Cupriavidus sp. 2MCAB6]|uniref:hypothetical protein n=1 Tax=Cupriavidus sp. 2MCAB6 TaxID=3232981 RepID=UPI003F8E7064